MSSDSQTPEEQEPAETHSKFLELLKETDQSPRRSSPRKKQPQTLSPAGLKWISPCKKSVSTSSETPKKAKESLFGEKSVAKTKNNKPLKVDEDVRERKTTAKTKNNEPVKVEVEIKEKAVEVNEEHSLWVEKHKPTNTKKIIGQQGDKSNVKKLTEWLKNWYKNNGPSKKAVFVPSKAIRLHT